VVIKTTKDSLAFQHLPNISSPAAGNFVKSVVMPPASFCSFDIAAFGLSFEETTSVA
jgi:hypothetical protein